MAQDINYDDIRSFYDSEVDHYLKVLLQDKGFQDIMGFVFKKQSRIEQVKHALKNVHTVNDLQFKVVKPIFEELILTRSTDGQTFSGLEKLDKTKSYLFISNHRDIVLDSTMMNYLILQEGMNTTEVAIGSNLLIEKWIEYVMKLNRAFVVRRNLPARELLLASKKLSSYIRSKISEENISVWIAQREGRTKNGDDKTQPALLKMLNLSNKKDFIDGVKELRIVPVSISYEIEPSGLSKVSELYQKQTAEFEKTEDDDMKSMEDGVLRANGRVHFGFGAPISPETDFFNLEKTPTAKVEKLSEYIDQQIYENYKLWPNNYIAFDILENTDSNKLHYTSSQFTMFKDMLNEAVEKISGDDKIIRKLFLVMYANPVINIHQHSLVNK